LLTEQQQQQQAERGVKFHDRKKNGKSASSDMKEREREMFAYFGEKQKRISIKSIGI